MKNVRTILMAASVCILAGCSGGATEVPTYPYFTSMPSTVTFEEQYTYLRHTLSPIKRYHFRIGIPKNWETLDLILQEEPEPGAFAEMAVFREPGAWMNGEEIQPDAEITVTAVNAQQEKRWASVWLQEIIEKNVPGVNILEERTMKNGTDEAADILFSYTDDGRTIMTRMAAFRQNDRFYVISTSDSSNGYRDKAEVFYVAIASFVLEEDSDANPFHQ